MTRLWIIKIILVCFLVKVQTASVLSNLENNEETVKRSDVAPLEAVKLDELNDIGKSSSDAARRKKSAYYYPVSIWKKKEIKIKSIFR